MRIVSPDEERLYFSQAHPALRDVALLMLNSGMRPNEVFRLHRDNVNLEEQFVFIPEGKTMCSLCSRLRRGALYRVAGELGATKIALGHHRDDILATFFLNMFHGGQLKAMPAKLRSDDGRHVVIRPLAYVAEADLAAYAEEKRFPIIPCNLCGSQENLERRRVGEMLAEWQKRHPGRIESIVRALTEVRPSHLLDRKLYDFSRLA